MTDGADPDGIGGDEGADDDNPPPGYVPSRTRGPFSTHNGPFFHKLEDDAFFHGFRARRRHCNGHGIVHGGLLMTFMDGALGTAVWRATGLRTVTLRMTSDFLSMARPGEWIEATAALRGQEPEVAFVEGRVSVGTRLVLSASALFKLMPAKR